MTEIQVEYIRPGKDTSFYVEDLIHVDARRLKTFKLLPPDVVARLNRSLIAEGLIAPHQRAVMISKKYFFDENFNLLKFCDEDGNLLGYYSDIGTPLIRPAPPLPAWSRKSKKEFIPTPIARTGRVRKPRTTPGAWSRMGGLPV